MSLTRVSGLAAKLCIGCARRPPQGAADDAPHNGHYSNRNTRITLYGVNAVRQSPGRRARRTIRPAAALEKAGGRYAAGLLLQLPALGVRFHCEFLMQSVGEALAGFGFPEQESRAERGRLRFHKRPKSREETPKEGSDSGVGGGHYRIPLAKTIAISGSIVVGDHGPKRRFMALALEADHFRTTQTKARRPARRGFMRSSTTAIG